MDNQINKERSSETALKKKSRIAPVLIGVVCAVLIVIVVTVVFYSNAPSRQLEKQMKLADKYVNVIGEPIPELALVADWAEKNKNDKVIIFGVSDEETAGVLKDKLGAEVVTFADMMT